MSTKPTARKNIPWRTVAPEDWDKGCPHVAGLMGVTPAAAYAARGRLMSGKSPERRSLPVPPGLQPSDSPAAVVRRHGVSLPTAKKWLRSLGRAPAPPGRLKKRPFFRCRRGIFAPYRTLFQLIPPFSALYIFPAPAWWQHGQADSASPPCPSF